MMSVSTLLTPPILDVLPNSMPLENAIDLDFSEGVLILRASSSVQSRVESLLDRQRESGLTASENTELDAYEEMDDYLSFLNRISRNLQIGILSGN